MTPVNNSSQFVQANAAVAQATFHVVHSTTKAAVVCAGAGLPPPAVACCAVAGMAHGAHKGYQAIQKLNPK